MALEAVARPGIVDCRGALLSRLNRLGKCSLTLILAQSPLPLAFLVGHSLLDGPFIPRKACRTHLLNGQSALKGTTIGIAYSKRRTCGFDEMLETAPESNKGIGPPEVSSMDGRVPPRQIKLRFPRDVVVGESATGLAPCRAGTGPQDGCPASTESCPGRCQLWQTAPPRRRAARGNQ